MPAGAGRRLPERVSRWSILTDLQNGKKVWAPFYTIHKIMAGLLDMYLLTGNKQALEVLVGMADWTDKWTGQFTYSHMQQILNTEFGGMGEVLLNLYAVTGEKRYLDAADRFNKGDFPGSAAGAVATS